ncbi:2-C-methyl-D-erythritol 2,4-cyclodiphosphate synthase [marine gamma proteobacterium HTCC2143]|jgi:2-C-methyl-D-erythritol 2,4-cyclodiphosphate synthase|uniref:2-C-methyl-D-erythritol 2,4-cyclodiphosphate synthase n=1 Tax=marine gamma proteobacterium HTCC2143 TaxID=247633 RepID=A0YEP3_9GAMM|nr:2-C-methyl-D-erythritol 2,4-cyclodiphosphate synthase [marine gamma proteobacterium HTCC2143]
MRIGHGYDVHRFGEGDHIQMGGVTIPHDRGLVAHSDGDVALHALCDALLGACALGDIGSHFPDTDSRYKNINSRDLLKQVYQLVLSQGYRLANADITIIAQSPKMAPFIEPMRIAIAAAIAVDIGQLSVKATTTETLGFAGRKEGIAVHAVVLLLSA